MAYSLFPKVQGTATLQEVVEYAHKNTRYGDQESILGASEILSALANDRELIINAANSQLSDALENILIKAPSVSTQSLVLYSDPKIKIRANSWRKPVERAGSVTYDSSIFSYDYPHNHNFELLTVGYLGSGYWTEIHECKPDELKGYVGEKVEIKFLEKTSLPRSKVLYFRARSDIHDQIPPDEFSISLNLIVTNSDGPLDDQFNFDIARKEIMTVVSTQMSGQISLFRLASLLGMVNSYDAVAKFAFSNAHWRARLSAIECAIALSPADRDRILTTASEDSDEYIKTHAIEQLNLLN